MNNSTISSRFACVEKTTTESTANAKFQSLVEPTHTGTVPNANATLDLFPKTAIVFSWQTHFQFVQPTPDSTVSLVFAKPDSTKYQDLTVRDAPMDKFGMVHDAAGTLLVQTDTYGMVNTTDVKLRPFNVHKTLNGTALSAFALPASTILVQFVSDVHQTLLGMEVHATHKYLPINARATKSS
jgi:hypothetical protein